MALRKLTSEEFARLAAAREELVTRPVDAALTGGVNAASHAFHEGLARFYEALRPMHVLHIDTPRGPTYRVVTPFGGLVPADDNPEESPPCRPTPRPR